MEQKRFEVLFSKGRNQTRNLYASVAFKDTAAVHMRLARSAFASKDYSLAATEFRLASVRAPALKEAQRGLQQALAAKHASEDGGTR